MLEHIEAFIVYMRDIKKMSLNTELSYKRDLTKLMNYLKNEKGIQSWDKVTDKDLEDYIGYLTDGNFAAASVSRFVVRMLSARDALSYSVRMSVAKPSSTPVALEISDSIAL